MTVEALREIAMEPPAVSMIAVSDLDVSFGGLAVIEGMSLSIHSGEFVSLLGPSGCGKSTLLKVIAGLVQPTRGRVETRPPSPRVGVMFQKPLLLPWRTTLNNVLLPLELGFGGGAIRAADRARALDLLELVGLRDFAGAFPHQLSGGMRQRAALARTLISDPDLLLLDEPFGALDELTRERLNEELIGIWHSGATRLRTVIMVTHSVPEAVTMSDRVFVLSPRPARVVDVVQVGLGYPRHLDNTALVRLIGHTRGLVRGVL